MSKPFNQEQEKEIVTAIAECEKYTTGEIRVHVNLYCKGSPVLKAENLFIHMNMHKTEDHNGVLIYVALEDHKIAVIGDKGIHAKVAPAYWQSVVDLIKLHFQNADIIKGIIEGVRDVGAVLAEHFPKTKGDQNELLDDISYS